MMSYISANHDERIFDNPRKFDAARSPNRHLAFGAGAHQCLGLHMARLEMRILFNELLDRIERFVEGGALLKDGTTQPADLIVLATGFVSQQVVMAKILGEQMTKKVGPVWGFGPDGEMSNMWKRTAQEGLWFVGGSFANCRTYSRYVAMQIKAVDEGLLAKGPDSRPLGEDDREGK